MLNRLPSSVINWKTPYHTLFGKNAVYKNMKCFGCLSYIIVIQPQKDKFRPRARKGVFVGYASGQNGYKVYDIDAKDTSVNDNPSLHVVPISLDEDYGSRTNVPVHNSDQGGQQRENSNNSVNDSDTTCQNLEEEAIQTRQSLRIKQKPIWSNDFVLG